MKIVSKYLLKEHFGPFLFALTSLTSIMLLQYIARRFGDVVGKGLSWWVIAKFFLLSVPFTVAMTMPMAVLVAVLYAFSRLAAENEITALKAGGVSMKTLMIPTVWAGAAMAFLMLLFNDQVLPRANHELAMLQTAIFNTKPTFVLRPQVINAVKEGQLYLRAVHIDQATSKMRGVTIYDLSDPTRRRTVYADSGFVEMAPNQKDLAMTLYHGEMQTVETQRADQLTRLFYIRDRLTIADVMHGFAPPSDSEQKSDREMSVCEMQDQLVRHAAAFQKAQQDVEHALWQTRHLKGIPVGPEPKPQPLRKVEGIGGVYCAVASKIAGLLQVKELHAETLPQQRQQPRDTTKKAAQDTNKKAAQDNTQKTAQDTSKKTAQDTTKKAAQDNTQKTAQDSTKKAAQDTAKKAAPAGPPVPNVVPAPAPQNAQQLPQNAQQVPPPPQQVVPPVINTGPPPSSGFTPDLAVNEARLRLEDARFYVSRYSIEIQKKFALAAACIVFVLIGAPIALRFPRGGIGLVIGVSFLIFSIYYVFLIAGESLANKGMLSPVVAMWAANELFLAVAIVLLSRMGREAATSRGGDLRDTLANLRARLGRLVGLRREYAA